MAVKKLSEFTISELVNRAIGGFGEQDTEGHAKFEDERHALYAVLNFKLGQEQVRFNTTIRRLTWALLFLTLVMVVKMFM